MIALVIAFRTFDAISVREEFAYEQLCDLTELPIKITVDPTFLLEKEEWIKLMKKSTINKIPSKYILTYFVSSNKRSTKYYSIIEKSAIVAPRINLSYGVLFARLNWIAKIGMLSFRAYFSIIE